MCTVCFSQTRFGEKIPKNHYLGWIEEQQEGALNLFKNISLQSYSDLHDLPEYVFPIALNQFNPNFGTLYTPYFLPLKENGREVMDFADIADKAEGKHNLAMLKADVDNLGYIFSSGMGKRISLSRYAALSRMQNFYFSASINYSLKMKYRNLYVVFSGGDDLCLIGPWNEVLDYVAELQDEMLEEAEGLARKIRCVMAPNMSVGVNVMFKIAGEMARILGDDYDMEILEVHHRLKKDAPIGTAVRLAQVLASVSGRDLEEVGVYERRGMIGERTDQEIGIQTWRAGDITGEHTVMFGGIGERLELIHRAHNRDNFARGAVRAALWVVNQPEGLYDMQDVLGLN